MNSARLRQVSQPVENIERAVGFYADVLGLRLIARPGPLAFFDLGAVTLFMEPHDETQPFAPGGVLYLDTDDIAGEIERLTTRGIAFDSEPHRIYTDDGTFGHSGAEHWMAFFKDSEGNTLALYEVRAPQ